MLRDDANTEGSEILLPYNDPYHFEGLLKFFSVRALAGAEKVEDGKYARTVRMTDPDGNVAVGWISVEDRPDASSIALTLSESLAPVASQVIDRIRHQFDLDADPHSISSGLSTMREVASSAPFLGTRVPGCFDPFETACRAILGQQVTVKAANSIAARVIAAHGTPVETPEAGLDLVWPTPKDVLAIDDPESALGTLGVVKSRTNAILEIARMLESGELNLGLGTTIEEQMDALLSIKGIGPWTANYIAMRVLGHKDAFLESDAGVAHALPSLSPKERLAIAEGWHPWRSYAVINLWNSLDGE